VGASPPMDIKDRFLALREKLDVCSHFCYCPRTVAKKNG